MSSCGSRPLAWKRSLRIGAWASDPSLANGRACQIYVSPASSCCRYLEFVPSLLPRIYKVREGCTGRSSSSSNSFTESVQFEAMPTFFESPALLKAQLLQVLRGRLVEAGAQRPGEASLRMRKWVIWNGEFICHVRRVQKINTNIAWTRRPVLSQPSWSTLFSTVYTATGEQQEVSSIDPTQESLHSLQRHLVGDMSQYKLSSQPEQPLANSTPRAISTISHEKPVCAIEVRSNHASKPRPSKRRPAVHKKSPSTDSISRPYALRSIACSA
jgi:hypothetical protein